MDFPIPFQDFGGDGALLHFSHANGYPPGSYRQLLKALASRHHTVAMCNRPLWPDQQPDENSGFRSTADDLIQFCEQEGIRQAIGVGHSLGAVATMYAAVERPDLFRCLVLIEPVFLPPFVLDLLRENPHIVEKMPDHLSMLHWWPVMIKRARQRRNQWPDRQVAFAHFRSKSVFRHLSDGALMDYVVAGTAETGDDSVKLAYPREWEATFYARPALDVWQVLPQVQQPTLAIRAGDSNTLAPVAWQHWQTLQSKAVFEEIPGATHLLPFEQPQQVAEIVLRFLARAT